MIFVRKMRKILRNELKLYYLARSVISVPDGIGDAANDYLIHL